MQNNLRKSVRTTRRRARAAREMSPRKTDVRTFVDALFMHATPGKIVSLRAFVEKGGRAAQTVAWVEPVRITNKLAALKNAAFSMALRAANAEEARVFCPPIATFRSEASATESNVYEGLALSIDLDKNPDDGLALLIKILGAPTLCMETGGLFSVGDKDEAKRHVHYRLKRAARLPSDKHRLVEARKLAAELVDGDPSGVPLCHPLRWPSVHRKGKPKLCELEIVNPEVEVELREVLQKLRAAVARKRAKTRKIVDAPGKAGVTTAPPVVESDGKVSEWIQQVVSGASYHDPLTRLAMSYSGQRIAQRTAVEMLCGFMNAVPEAVRDGVGQGGYVGRWRDRFNDIPRLVTSAYVKADDDAPWDEPLDLPAKMPTVRPLKPDMLPDRLRPWLLGTAARMQAPLDFLAVAAIVAAGSLIGRQVAVQPKARDTEWYEPANLWGGIVAPPGFMKTPAVRAALRGIEALEAEARAENEAAWAAHQAALREYELRRRAVEAEVKKRLKSNPEDDISDLIEAPPPEPRLRRHTVVDSTQEALGKIHADNPNGVMVHRDELVPFLIRLEDPKNSADYALFLSGWSGKEPWTYDRIGRGHISLPAVCLSLFGTTQPERVQTFIAKSTKDDGLIQRFSLLVWPDISPDWENIDETPDEAQLKAVREVYSSLVDLPFSSSDDRLPMLKFSKHAQPIFDAWRQARKAPAFRVDEFSVGLAYFQVPRTRAEARPCFPHRRWGERSNPHQAAEARDCVGEIPRKPRATPLQRGHSS